MPRNLGLIVLLGVFPACGQQGDTPHDVPAWQAHAGVQEAHEAYLAEDWLRMVGAVRTVLADPATSNVERANMLELLESGYEATKSRLPADWQLPAAIERLTITQRHVSNDEGLHYTLSVQVVTPEKDAVTRVTLKRSQDIVVLDSDGVGVELELNQADEGRWEFGVATPERDAPEADGLYWVRIELKNGEAVEGWTVISGLASSATPVLHEPQVGEVYDSATPRFAWDDFRSPQFKGFERRHVAVYVGTWSPNRTPQWQDVWGFYPSDVRATEVRPSSLADGRYHMGVVFHELRSLGPVRLRRTSQTSRSFAVRQH